MNVIFLNVLSMQITHPSVFINSFAECIEDLIVQICCVTSVILTNNGWTFFFQYLYLILF